MLHEFYARGLTAPVRYLGNKERSWFPKADLVREETCIQLEAQRRFYFHQIARLLFPKNFINVTGATFPVLASAQFDRLPLVASQTFSVLAPISPDHADFSSHMGLPPIGYGDERKIRTCCCPICLRHEKVHQKLNGAKFWRLTNEFNRAGIFVPSDDPTDYCLTNMGDIIFFELDFIDLSRATDYISRRKYSQSTQHRVFSLSRRMAEIFYQNRIALKSA